MCRPLCEFANFLTFPFGGPFRGPIRSRMEAGGDYIKFAGPGAAGDNAMGYDRSGIEI